MTIYTPAHAVIKADTLSKWQLSRKLPGKFSLTVQRGDWLTRYVSQNDGFAIAEAWLNKLDGHSPDHWCLIDMHEGDHVFFMQVQSGVVREATTLKMEDISAIKLSLNEKVYLTSVLEEDARFKAWSCEIIPPLEEREWQPYQLKPDRKAAFAVGGILFMSCLAFTMWQPNAPSTSHTAMPKVGDVYQGYRQTMSYALSAADGIDDALVLTSVSALAPSGWDLKKVTLQGETVVSVIERNEFGLRSTVKYWLGQINQPATSILTIDTLTLKKPVDGKLSQWREKLASYSLGFELVDVLLSLGWHVNDSKESKSATTGTLDVTLDKNSLALSEMTSLSALFRPLPLSLQALTLTPNTDGTYRASMRLQYIGENHENH